MEEEIYILGATLLESPRGPLCNQRDARDEDSLCEPARLLGRVWEDKRYTEGIGGPATYDKKKTACIKSSIMVLPAMLLPKHRRKSFLNACSVSKGNNKYGREKISKT